MFWDILIVLGLLWIYLSFLSFLQNVYMNKAYYELKEMGTIYYGKDGRFLNNKMILIASVDSLGKIAGAKILKTSRILIPPKLVPFDDIVGKSIFDIDLYQIGDDEKIHRAINNLEVNYKKIVKES